MMFECSKCGLCCRMVNKSEIYAELDRGDGVCRYLKDNLCSIYESRPLICRVDESYDAFFKDIYTRKEFYEMNYKACEFIKNKVWEE